MNRKNMNKIEKIARQNFDNVQVLGIMDAPGSYAVSVENKIFYSADQFFAKYPQFHTPYRVVNTEEGSKVVCVESVDDNRVRPIDGGKLYPQRQGANRRCKQLNDEWHKKNDEAYAVQW